MSMMDGVRALLAAYHSHRQATFDESQPLGRFLREGRGERSPMRDGHA